MAAGSRPGINGACSRVRSSQNGARLRATIEKAFSGGEETNRPGIFLSRSGHAAHGVLSQFRPFPRHDFRFLAPLGFPAYVASCVRTSHLAKRSKDGAAASA